MDTETMSPTLLLALLQTDKRWNDLFLTPAALTRTYSMSGSAAVVGSADIPVAGRCVCTCLSLGLERLLMHSPEIDWSEIGATPDTDTRLTVFPEACLSAPQPDTESQPLRVLLVEDSPTDVRLLQEMLAASTTELVQITHVERLMEALHQLATERFDAILLDLSLPDSQGLDTFTTLHARTPAMPTVVLTGLDDKALAVGAVRAGAQDSAVDEEGTGNPGFRMVGPGPPTYHKRPNS